MSTRTVARAIRDHTAEQVRRAQSVRRARVVGVRPLRVELASAGLVLQEDDDFVVSGTLESHIDDYGIKAGEHLLLVHEGGDWTAFDVEPGVTRKSQLKAVKKTADKAKASVIAATTRVTALEAWRNGSKGAGRWYAPVLTTTIAAGWTWSGMSNVSGGLAPDASFYQIVTPPGQPITGVNAGSNSGIKVLQSGVYRARLGVLQYFPAGTSGRIDTGLYILNGTTGAIYSQVDNDLTYAPAASAYVKGRCEFDALIDAGQIIWANNAYGQAYGDPSGAWSSLHIRYLGTR